MKNIPEPRKRTYPRSVSTGGWTAYYFKSEHVEWEDPETGEIYATKRAARRGIAKRLGVPYREVDRSLYGDCFFIYDADGNVVPGTGRYATRAEAKAALKELEEGTL